MTVASHAFSLQGRVALITGSSRGLGRAMALAMGKAGAKVAINYCFGKERAEQTFAEFTESGCVGTLVRADVTDADDVARMCTQVARELGPIDIVVANATGDQPQRAIEEYGWDVYQEMVDYFVKSPYLLARQVLPHMKKQRWGRILNIGSEVFHRGVGNFSAYAAAKGAQDGWTRSMATELAPWQVTVNIISPGWIPVERHDKDPKQMKDAYRALIPMRRWGVPDDIAGAAVFLASDAASFITGQNLCVNGGLTVG